MLYILTFGVYGYLFWRMSYLPYRAYTNALFAFDCIEEERGSYFQSHRGNDPELDARSNVILDEIKDPGIFFIKQMSISFCYCVLFSIFALWVFFRRDMITLTSVRIIGSGIFACCLLILSIHICLIRWYKKQARKEYEEKCRKEEIEEKTVLQNLLKRTSFDYDATETD